MQLAYPILCLFGSIVWSQAHDASQGSLLSSLAGSTFNFDGQDSSYWLYPAVTKHRSNGAGIIGNNNETKNGTTKSRTDFEDSEIGRLYGRSFARLIGFFPEFLQDLLRFVLDNPFVGVVGLGSLMAFVKQYFWILYNKCHEQYTTTLEVFSDQPTYRWLENWLNAKDWGDCQHVTGVAKTYTHDDCCECEMCEGSNGPGGAPDFQLIPNLSQYGFDYKGQWIEIGNSKDKKDKEQAEKYSFGQHHSMLTKSLTLTTTGKSPAIFHDLLAECRQFFINQTVIGTSTTVWTTSHGCWNHNGNRRKRPLESVILGEGVLDDILADITDFIQSAKWYIERGIPYRRGYLLYGPPGCGKTSIISAIAGHLDYGVSILSLSDQLMTDDTLRELINDVPERSILLLEDIDAAFESRAKGFGRNQNGNSVSFSGLLNAIDGVASADARILFMTTNYVDRLDSALIRPGRVDMKRMVDYCSEDQICKLFKRFYPQWDQEELETLAETFTAKVRTSDGKKVLDVTPAELQGFLLLYRYDPKKALDNTDSFIADLEKTRKKRLKKLEENVEDGGSIDSGAESGAEESEVSSKDGENSDTKKKTKKSLAKKLKVNEMLTRFRQARNKVNNENNE